MKNGRTMAHKIPWDWLSQHLDQTMAACGESSGRLLHGRSGSIPGLEHVIIDVFPPLILVICFGELPDPMLELTQLLERLAKKHGLAGEKELQILLQNRQGGQTRWQVLLGSGQEHHIASYLGLHFELQFGKNQNVGLFMDMALGHELVRQLAPGKSILNLFAYTCAFSVFALHAGAARVVNVDMSKSALNQGKRNHRLNQLDSRQAMFLSHNVMKSMSAFRKHGPFDLIICDPPTYQPPSFEAARDYPKLIRRLPQILKPGGEILACLNAPMMTRGQFRSWFDESIFELIQLLGRPPAFGEPDSDRDLKIAHYRCI